jgi:hypothetical protein
MSNTPEDHGEDGKQMAQPAPARTKSHPSILERAQPQHRTQGDRPWQGSSRIGLVAVIVAFMVCLAGYAVLLNTNFAVVPLLLAFIPVSVYGFKLRTH